MILPAEGDFRLDTEAATQRLGEAIAKALEAGEAVCLTGPLGAGKSVLARALVRALDPSAQDVPSPTFTLVQFYDGPRWPIAHFDLYRIDSADEAFEIGLDEAISRGVAVVEWAERLGHHLPHNRLDVELILGEGESRRARLSGHGSLEGRPLVF